MTTADSTHLPGVVPSATVVAPAAAKPLDQSSFFQALREIERSRPSQPRVGYAVRPADEPVRINQPAEMTFAPSTLVGTTDFAALAPGEPRTARDERLADRLPPVRLQQRFLGLLGPAGPMPLHVTEAVRDRLRHAGDESLQAFLDIFHHRIATLFYRAWSDAQPIVQHDRASITNIHEDGFASYLGALAGTNGSSRDAHVGSLNDVQRYTAGHFIGTHRHAEGLESLLTYALRAPARVTPLALRTLVLANEERSALTSYQRSSRCARRTNCLGQSAQLGSTVHDRTSMIDVRVGPVPYALFQQYLPGGPARSCLAALVRQYAGPAIDARVTIELHRAQVPPAVLGQSGQLGRTAWITGTASPVDRDDYRFEVNGTAGERTPTNDREAA